MHSAVLAGVMSGTSLDGVTAAVARFQADGGDYRCELLAVETVPYEDALRERVRAALHHASAAEYCALGFELGERFASAALLAVAGAGVPRAEVAAIAIHGHTMWHAPPAGTWQLGEGAAVAERLGIDVIEDFRVRDVAAGGQGAPLVPIADALLFGRADAPRALQNIGGMANVTVVPIRGSLSGVRAFDTGPGVALIDAVTRAGRGAAYDRDGAFARQGRVIDEVVAQFLRHEFFHREPPKSTGRETFNDAFAAQLADACRAARKDCTADDIIATATEFTARSIADAYARFVPEPLADVLLSGGGAANAWLRERLAQLLAPTAVELFTDRWFPGDAKEAVAFAFLGFLHLRNEPANVPLATGARGPRVLGKRVPA